MGQERELDTPEAVEPEPTESRRHRPASELRITRSGDRPPSTSAASVMTEALRTDLWQVVHAFLFAPHEEFDRWTHGVTGRPSVRRVWSAPPISGIPNRIPEDVAELLGNWFALVEPEHAWAFVEAVHANLETPSRHKFAAGCNAALERQMSDHRFVLRRLAPITSKADVLTIERGFSAIKKANVMAAEEHLEDALERLARKPDADPRGSIQEAIRAVEVTAFALTGGRHLSLEETLEDLEELGHVDAPLKAAYGGLFAYVGGQSRRTTTTDDARLILVMCAGFISHRATKMAR